MFCRRVAGSPGVREPLGPVRAPSHGHLDGVPALRRLPRRIVRHLVHAVHGAALPRRRLLRRRHPGEYRLHFITVRNSSCGKVMFSQSWFKNSVQGGGGMHNGGACMIGDMRAGGHAWGLGACMAGGGREVRARSLQRTYRYAPTGMHSYLNYLLFFTTLCGRKREVILVRFR